jgi:hypothetical protein
MSEWPTIRQEALPGTRNGPPAEPALCARYRVVTSQPYEDVAGSRGSKIFDSLALLRNFPIAEGWNVQARWEVFNVTNTPEFGQPQGNITSGGVAAITTLSGDPRVMQFALRLSF